MVAEVRTGGVATGVVSVGAVARAPSNTLAIGGAARPAHAPGVWPIQADHWHAYPERAFPLGQSAVVVHPHCVQLETRLELVYNADAAGMSGRGDSLSVGGFMRRLGLCVPFVVLALIGCGSSRRRWHGRERRDGRDDREGRRRGRERDRGSLGDGRRRGRGRRERGRRARGIAGGSAGAGGKAGAGGGSAGASGNAGAGGGSAGAGGDAGATGSAGNGGAGGALAALAAPGRGPESNAAAVNGTASGPCVVTVMSSGTAPAPAGVMASNGKCNLTSSTFYGTLPDGGAER